MATVDDIKTQIQACADASGNLRLRVALGDPAGIQIFLPDTKEARAPGASWSVPGAMHCIIDGIAKYLDSIPKTLWIGPTGFTAGSQTNPTTTVIGTTPKHTAFVFDATTKALAFNFRVPTLWPATTDVEVVLVHGLGAAESNGNVIEWTLDYVACTPGGPDSLTKTSTQRTGTVQVTTAGGLAQHDVYATVLTLPRTDGANPIVAGDYVACEIFRTSVGGGGKVGTVNLAGIAVQYR